MTDLKTISIDGVNYVRADSVRQPITGNRAVVVVDRGWIFAGDVERSDGRIRISNAVHVFKWLEKGFAAMIDDPKSAKADLRPIADVDIPVGAEVFCVPVADGWGL